MVIYDVTVSRFILFKPGGYPWKILMGVCRPVLLILTFIQTKKCHFSLPFSDLASKIHTRFKTWLLLVRCYVIITLMRKAT